MIRYACSTDEIEIPILLARSIPAFFFVSFILQIITFKSAIEVKKVWVKRIKILDFLYFILLLIFVIVAFAGISQIDQSSKQDTWNSLSPLVKSFYDNSINVLVVLITFNLKQQFFFIKKEQTQNNLILVGIFHLIVSILFLFNAVLLWNFDYTMPLSWHPKSRNILSLEKGDEILRNY